MKNNLVVTIIVAVIVGGAAFFGGMQYQKSQRGNFEMNSFRGPFTGTNQKMGTGTQRSAVGLRPVGGEIVSIDNNTITVKTQDGSSKIVIYSTSTKVNKTTEGSKSDLKVGETIMAIGSESSGAITAQSISVGNKVIQGGMPGGVQPGQGGQLPPATAQ
jgi:hypothetical protein